jgi:hypothetical protein
VSIEIDSNEDADNSHTKLEQFTEHREYLNLYKERQQNQLMQFGVLQGKHSMASKLRGKSEEEIKTDDLIKSSRRSFAEPLAQSRNFKQIFAIDKTDADVSPEAENKEAISAFKIFDNT